LLRAIYERLPPRTRVGLKKLAFAVGHKASFLDPLRAKHHATTKKRFDAVASYLSKHLSLAGVSDLRGKRCLEFGCGHLPTELAYYWLLGASNLIAIDYHRIAHFKYMHLALQGSEAANFDWRAIEYFAPFDAATQKLPDADFIHSEAVLEHIRPSDVGQTLRNLAAALPCNGIMIHNIDLRDHMFWHEDPNAFLRANSDYRDSDHDVRGNRLRKSAWIRLFEQLGGFHIDCHTEVVTPQYLVPGYSLDDLSALRVVIVARKLIS
jgi:hypothetical protein